MKHAYMIMAHNKEQLLLKLISMLDDINNDIYIHIDKKSDISYDSLKSAAKYSKITFTERINVEWGGYSQIQATIILLKEALKSDHIYYHMLSGVDLPLEKIQEINSFYEKNPNRQFIRYFSEKKAHEEYNKRFGFKNIFKDKFGRKNSIWKILNKIAFKFQQIFNMIDNSLSGKFYLGSSSWDITEDLAKDIVSHEDEFEKIYRWTSCCDEVFLQSFVYNSKYINQLWVPYSKNGNGMYANMRYINFEGETNGSPQTISTEDVDALIDSGLNFARKFDIVNTAAEELIEKINNAS